MQKTTIRERIWDRFEADGIARFPFPPHGRIPNFADYRTAAERFAETAAWNRAETLKCNPDAPQLPVRRRALRAGKTIYMAVPRLRDPQPFFRLDPAEIDDIDAATTVSGCSKYGVGVDPEEMPHIDLIVAGSVAVDRAGNRVGKGEGYSDLEFGVLSEFDRVDDTTVATTVHETQVVDDGEITPAAHDVPLDRIVTPTETIHTTAADAPHQRPSGIDWPALSTEQLDAIPVLARLQPDADR